MNINGRNIGMSEGVHPPFRQTTTIEIRFKKAQYSSTPVFLHPSIPPPQYSSTPVFLHPSIPPPQYSSTPVFLHPSIPTPQYSYTPVFLHPSIPTPQYSFNTYIDYAHTRIFSYRNIGVSE